MTTASPRRTTSRVSSLSVTVSHCLPGSGNCATAPPGTRTETGAKSSAGKIEPDLPRAQAENGFSLLKVANFQVGPGGQQDELPAVELQLRLRPVRHAHAAARGIGLLLENSSQSPPPDGRTHTEPSSTLTRATA